MIRAATIAAVLLGACGTDASPELVVRDAALGGGTPTVLGADASAVYWAVTAGTAPKLVAGSSLSSLPADGLELGMASGPIAHVGDHVVYATSGMVVRASVTVPAAKVATVVADALGESLDTAPVLVWTQGAAVSWGNGDVMASATLSKVVRCDHVRITETSIYVAADGTSGERRLFRIDRATGAGAPLSASSTHAAAFPGGAVTGATYRGRLVGTDARGAQWLVEETAAGATAPERAILVAVPEQGEPTVVLDRVTGASAFFTRPDAFFWQEGDALLTAPRSGGAASIVGQITGTIGAIDSGFVYYVDGSAIERLAIDGAD